MIEIRTPFCDWREVDKERARGYSRFLASQAVGIPESKRIDFIDKTYLRGITCKELGVDVKDWSHFDVSI